MRKVIVLLLGLFFTVGNVVLANSEQKILGNWNGPKDSNINFQSDGTGLASDHRTKHIKFLWSKSKENPSIFIMNISNENSRQMQMKAFYNEAKNEIKVINQNGKQYLFTKSKEISSVNNVGLNTSSLKSETVVISLRPEVTENDLRTLFNAAKKTHDEVHKPSISSSFTPEQQKELQSIVTSTLITERALNKSKLIDGEDQEPVNAITNNSVISSGAINNVPPHLGTALPPDPGAAGKATLAGIDADTDGVRDDVQIAIYERYPDDALKRSTLTQNAIALQKAIIAGASPDGRGISTASKLVTDAVSCMAERLGDHLSKEVSFLETLVVNTADRGQAYIHFNGALGGSSFAIDSDSRCL